MKNFKRNKKSPAGFWNKEYGGGAHLALSNTPSEDLIRCVKWLERNDDLFVLNSSTHVLDLGCGNGRNLIYLAKTYHTSGVGYDISAEAIKQAEELSQGARLEYKTRSIVGPIDLPDESQDMVLDMMTSHFLNADERKKLVCEIYRVLKPGGWLYFKTFFKDEDINAARLLKEHPAKETGSYIHPKIGVAEHVFTEDEINKILSDGFNIQKMLRSHRHIEKGHAAKRRSISVYAQKI